MKISADGIEMIKEFEGLRLESYQDSVGVWTVGWGHTGKHVHEGMHITEKEAEQLLVQDLERFERCVGHMASIPLTQGQFDALISFSLNLGCQALKKSTLLKRINKHRFAEAAGEFHRWNHAGGHVLAGLTRRRKNEKEMFLS